LQSSVCTQIFEVPFETGRWKFKPEFGGWSLELEISIRCFISTEIAGHVGIDRVCEKAKRGREV
jgi:hypothetical protein